MNSIVDPISFSQKYNGAFLSMEISDGSDGENPTLTVTIRAENNLGVVIGGNAQDDTNELTFMITEPMEISEFRDAMKAFK